MEIPSSIHFEIIPDNKLLPLPDVHIDITTHDFPSSLTFLKEVRFHDRVTFHLPARLLRDDQQFDSILKDLEYVSEVVVLAGDEETAWGPFKGALDILPKVRKTLHAKIGVASYPEGHPFIKDSMKHLKEKAKYADFIITQVCADPVKIDDHIRQIRESEIMLPIRIGLVGICDPTPYKFLRRFSHVCSADPLRILKEVTGYESIMFSCFKDIRPTLKMITLNQSVIPEFRN